MSYCRTVKAKTTQQKPPRSHKNQTEMDHDSTDGYGRHQTNIHGLHNVGRVHPHPHQGSGAGRRGGEYRNSGPLGRGGGGGGGYPYGNPIRRDDPSLTGPSQQYNRHDYSDPDEEEFVGGAHQPPSHHINSGTNSQHQEQSSSLYRVTHNPKKYAKMKEIAHHEEVLHEEYIAEKKERITQQLRTQEPQRLGGTTKSQEQLDATRRQQEQQLRKAKLRKKIEKEEKDAQRKRQEQEKIEQYKLEQRKKAERLEQVKREEERRNRVDLEDLRKKRLERFN